MLEKGDTGLSIGRADPKIDALKNLPPPIDPIATLGIDPGLLNGDTGEFLFLKIQTKHIWAFPLSYIFHEF